MGAQERACNNFNSLNVNGTQSPRRTIYVAHAAHNHKFKIEGFQQKSTLRAPLSWDSEWISDLVMSGCVLNQVPGAGFKSHFAMILEIGPDCK